MNATNVYLHCLMLMLHFLCSSTSSPFKKEALITVVRNAEAKYNYQHQKWLIRLIQLKILFYFRKISAYQLMPLLLLLSLLSSLLLLLIRLQRMSTGSESKRATLWKNHIHFPFVILLSTVNYGYLLFIKFREFHNFHFATKRDFKRGSFWLLFIFT